MATDSDFPVYYPAEGPGDFYDDNGVDLTQIRDFLAKTPEQRLRVAEGFAEDTLRFWAQNGIRPLR
ncbi:MAG TPA: hypothetical protein VEX18_07215 [Polyangiaceae bacterium]|nr:hypothetical protein [Polyangiaceae bacterium]